MNLQRNTAPIVLATIVAPSAPAENHPQLGIHPLSEIIAAMTPEEKAMLVTGTGIPGYESPLSQEVNTIVPGAAGTTAAIPRLGIPGIVLADGPAGLRISPVRSNDHLTFYCTAFPIATLLACSWDTGLVNTVGKAIGHEALEYGVDVLLAPAMNIHRNPLGGRNFEYYAEDPLLSGKIAAAMVAGIQSAGVGASVKHFAANNHESNRMNINVEVSERALREIYLQGYHIAVKESTPWTIMSSYNKINGTYTSESGELLTDRLRNDWDYQGVVISDWFAGRSPVAQMIAGNDLLMPGLELQRKIIARSLYDGRLNEELLDRNISRILQLILQTPGFKRYPYSNKPDLSANALIARQAAAEGMVLLKNEKNTLPLVTGHEKIALFGVTSYQIITGGSGSGEVNQAYHVPLLSGINNSGKIPDSDLKNIYQHYIEEEEAKRTAPAQPFMPLITTAEMEVTAALCEQAAAQNDYAIITIGRSSGEFADRELNADFNLSRTEKNLIYKVSRSFRDCGKKTIVVLNIGGVIETASWKDQPDAILLAWLPGQEAGNAISDVLSGKVNPSGKLSSTFPLKYEDIPSSKGFPGKPPEMPETITYDEGIYTGYRYFNTFNVAPSYPFGYGLSYTTFSYSKPVLSTRRFGNSITISILVKNTGKTAGREVVQLYLSAPAVFLDKPAMELKGFAKTKLLAPGESQRLSFELLPESLVSFDTLRAAWVAEAGDYQVHVAPDSSNIRQTATFILEKEILLKESAVRCVKEKN